MRTICLATDFGWADGYVGALKGVLATLAPGAPVVDLAHTLPAGDIAHAAAAMAEWWPCWPTGTVHLVVVDPGVGGTRRPLAAELGGSFFVGPDNGLLTRLEATVPVTAAVCLDERRWWREPVSATFHGRDIFAPAAAALARGVALGELGSTLDPATLVRLPAEVVEETDAGIVGEIVRSDNFGNAITSLGREHLPPDAVAVVCGEVVAPLRRTYSDVPPGTSVALIGSSGRLEIAVRGGSAMWRFGLRSGDRVTVHRA